MTEMSEQTALIADLEHALAQANGRLIQLTEELGPWKARALRAEKTLEEGLNIQSIGRWMASKGFAVIDPDGKRVN
jgi:chromosome segregation ATPase